MKNIIRIGIVVLAVGLYACGSGQQNANMQAPNGGFTPQQYPTPAQTPWTYYGAGQCPVGYNQNGYQCIPNTNGNVVCPGGSYSNGYGCITNNWQCPSSYQCNSYGGGGYNNGGYNNTGYGGGYGYNYGYGGYGNTNTTKFCYLSNWGWMCN